jgi:hypothetical protein
MNPQILIDAIVRQTTVLVARLSTVEGVRSPLGHIANEVFVGLVAELENQGVSKKVIADMFGMALRSYRQKVQRLGESVTTRGVTLWSAVQRFLAERGSATRPELFAQFQYDEGRRSAASSTTWSRAAWSCAADAATTPAIASPPPRSCATSARRRRAGRRIRTRRSSGCRSTARAR